MGLRTKLRKFFYRQKHTKKINNLEFSNNVILITGGNSGIGLSLTKKLLELNNEIYVTYKEQNDKLLLIKDERLNIIKCDLRFEKNFDELKNKLEGKRINCVFNCAGILGPTDQNENFDFTLFKELMMANSLSILNIVQILLKQKHPLKFIINISSEGASFELNKEGNFYWYRISKTTVNAITQNLAINLNKKSKITCFSFDPGNVKTGMNPGGTLDSNNVVEMLIDIIVKNNDNLNGKFINLLNKELPW